MALRSPKVIAEVNCGTASELAVMSWEWVMRADGQVLYRLAMVDGRRERNQWSLVTQVPAHQLQSFVRDKSAARAMLIECARQRGHRPA